MYGGVEGAGCFFVWRYELKAITLINIKLC